MKHLFYLSFLAFALLSCEKQSDSSLTEPSNSYLPLQIGNYWVYQHVRIDSLNQETLLPQTDSVIVDRDTLINDHSYFILEGTNYPFNSDRWGIVDILRDSMGYLVDQTGRIKFSDSNFSDILDSKIEVIEMDTLYSLSYKMETEDNPYTVPAGVFEVLNYKGTVVSHQELPGRENPRYLHTRYSPGVGKVMQSYFYFYSPYVIEKQLIRYHINP
jgi:hypothetical protein